MIFWLKCVKLTTFCILHNFVTSDVVALIMTKKIVKYFVPPYFHVKNCKYKLKVLLIFY